VADKTTIIGAGAWGTTLSWLLAGQGKPVMLWARDPDLAERIHDTRENPKYLPGVALPDLVTATADLEAALTGVDTMVVAVPSHGFRDVAIRTAEYIADGDCERGQGSGARHGDADERNPRRRAQPA